MSTLREDVASLGPEQLQALRDRLQKAKRAKSAKQGKARKAGSDRIQRVQREGRRVFPASFSQRRLWLHEQLSPETVDYNLFSLISFEEDFHLPTVKATVAALVEHHEVFRTTFELVDGQPCQILNPPSSVDVAMVDLEPLDQEGDMEEAVARLIDGGLSEPFDLENGPMLRALVVRGGPEEKILLLFYHHIISDLWSQRLLPLDFDYAYRRLRRGRPLRLPEERLQYIDYAAWQGEHFVGAVEEEHLAYWRSKLGDLPPPLDLPTDRPRSLEGTSVGGRVTRLLDADAVLPILALGREHQATSMMAGLAVFKLLLHVFSGQRRIRVGAPLANREREEVQGMLGFFVNLVLLSSDVLAAPAGTRATIRDLLGEVRQTCVDGLRHQEFPYERLVELFQPERDPTRLPLIEVLFNFIPGELPGVEIDPEVEEDEDQSLVTIRSIADLTLMLEEKPWGWKLDLDFRADLFDRTSIERLMDWFVRGLQEVCESPDQPLEDISWLSSEERIQLLEEWSGQQRLESLQDLPPDLPEIITELCSRALGVPKSTLQGRPTLLDGADEALRLSSTLEQAFHIPIDGASLVNLPGIHALCEHLLELLEQEFLPSVVGV